METQDLSIEEQDAQRKEFIRNTFNTVAEAYGEGSLRFFHSCGEIMASLMNLQGNEHVLDVACGTGAAAIPLAKQLSHGNVTAVDFSEKMLEKARAYAQHEGLSNLTFDIQDMTNMTFATQCFDHANCAFGLFFVENMESLLTHIASKVKPKGRVSVSGFCGDSFMPASELTIECLKRYDVEIPEQVFGWQRMAEPEQLNELFSNAGLQDVDITRKSLGYYIDLEGWWDIIWYAGFRGMVSQVGDRLEEFKKEHLEEVARHMDNKGLWLEVDVNFTSGQVPE